MSALQITLSGPTKSFVETCAAEAGCSPDDFVQYVLQDFEENVQKLKLNSMLLVGYEQLRQGLGREMTDEDWRRLEKRIGKKTKKVKR